MDLLGIPPGPAPGEHRGLGTDRGDRRGARSGAGRSRRRRPAGRAAADAAGEGRDPPRDPPSPAGRPARAGGSGRDRRVAAATIPPTSGATCWPRSWPTARTRRPIGSRPWRSGPAGMRGRGPGEAGRAGRTSSMTGRCSPRRSGRSRSRSLPSSASLLTARDSPRPDADVRAAAVEVAGRLGLSGVGERVRRLLADRDQGVRRRRRRPQALGLKAAGDRLLELVRDPDPGVRRAGLDALRLLREPRAYRWSSARSTIAKSGAPPWSASPCWVGPRRRMSYPTWRGAAPPRTSSRSRSAS